MAVRIIEYTILTLAIFTQVIYFIKNSRLTGHLNRLMPQPGLYERNTSTDASDNTRGPILLKGGAYDYDSIVDNINRYLRNNRNAADFGIIQGIVREKEAQLEEEINASINLPLYIGLMGTFLGVGTGLFAIVFGKDENISNQTIDDFIQGVGIAMITSFTGLFLSVLSNSLFFRKAKAHNETGKQAFLQFLRIHILPNAGNSLAEVVADFRNNISRFNETLGKNLEHFDKQLSGNIDKLGSAVAATAKNIPLLVNNTQSNLQILEQLRSAEFQKMVEHQQQMVTAIQQAIPNLTAFTHQLSSLEQHMEKTAGAISDVGALMNRIKRFEEGVNGLGDRIQRADYLKDGMLGVLEHQMKSLDTAYHTIRQHAQNNSGQIEHHLTQESLKIKSLSAHVLAEIQEAMNFNIAKNPFRKLEQLDLLKTLEKLDKLDLLGEKLDKIVHILLNNTSLALTQKISIASPVSTEPERRKFNFFSFLKRRRHAGKK